jgi:hypothetical protein
LGNRIYLTPMGSEERLLDEEKEKTPICIICSADVPDETNTLIKEYVDRKKKEGYCVYCLNSITSQEDPIEGVLICEDNRQVIENASEVHLFYTSLSHELRFNLGIAFASGKKIILANKNMSPRVSPYESFGFDINHEIHVFHDNGQLLREYRKTSVINFRFDPFSNKSLFQLGMAFAQRKPIRLVNPEQFPPTKNGSFNNIIRVLDIQSRQQKEPVPISIFYEHFQFLRGPHLDGEPLEPRQIKKTFFLPSEEQKVEGYLVFICEEVSGKTRGFLAVPPDQNKEIVRRLRYAEFLMLMEDEDMSKLIPASSENQLELLSRFGNLLNPKLRVATK